jgi:endonuclease/exonuclease/phosphatase family metal-dependent hydrolase
MYNDPFWGGIVPRVNDLIFGWMFPIGYKIIPFNLAYMCAVVLILILNIILRKRKIIRDDVQNNHSTRFYILIGIGGLFFTPIAVGYLLFLLNIFQKELRDKLGQSKPKPLQIVLLIPILLVIIIIPFLVFYFSYFNRIDFVIIVSIIYGVLLIFGFIYLYTHKSMLFQTKNAWNPPKSFKKIGWVSYILILVLSMGLFILNSQEPINYVKPHAYNPSVTLDLNLITYNIRLGSVNEPNPLDNWNVRRDPFCKYLASLNGDIIGVQEAYKFQIDYIIKHTNNRQYQYTGLGRDDGVHGGEHSAILFDVQKFKLLDGETFWLSDPPSYPNRAWGNGNYRVVTWALFESLENQKQFYVFNTHFDFSNEFHINAVNLIHSKISRFTFDAPVFVMGDMNLRPDSVGYAAFVNTSQTKPLRDSYVVYHNGSDPFDFSIAKFDANYVPTRPYRIDFIFVSDAVDVNTCEIPKASYGINQTYSDHYPVVLKCKI